MVSLSCHTRLEIYLILQNLFVALEPKDIVKLLEADILLKLCKKLEKQNVSGGEIF